MSVETQPKPKRLTVGRGREIVRGPCVAGATLLVGCDADEIWCLDRTSLRKVWKADSEDQTLGYPLSPELFGTAGAREAAVRSLSNGRKVWTLAGPWGFRALSDGRVLCSRSRSGTVELRDVATGTVLHTFQEGGFGYGWLNGHVQLYVREDSFAAVDVEKGAEVWRRERWLVQREWGDEVLHDDRFFPTVHDGDVFATVAVGVVRISGKTGEILWTAPEEAVRVSGQGWFGQTPPVAAGAWVAVAGDLGELVIMEISTGAVVANWGRRLEKQLRGRPAISYKNRIAMCFEYGGGLAIYSVPDGELVRFIEHKWPLWELNEVDGRLFVSSGNGILLVYDESVWGL